MAAIIRNGDDVLLVRHSYRTSSWCLVGGTIDAGETPEECCAREIQEEVGLTPFWHRKFYDFFWTKEYKRDTVHVFAASVRDRSVSIDGDEIIESRWFPLNDLPEDIDALSRNALLEYEMQLYPIPPAGSLVS